MNDNEGAIQKEDERRNIGRKGWKKRQNFLILKNSQTSLANTKICQVTDIISHKIFRHQ